MQKRILVPVICFIFLCFSASVFAQKKTKPTKAKTPERVEQAAEIPPPPIKKPSEELGSGKMPMPEETPKPAGDEIFQIAEQQAEFPGGTTELMKYIKTNQQYPEIAKKDGIEGRVFLKFVIEKDGSVSNIIVLRSIHKLLDNEAIRVVKSMPKWTPGKQKGQIVRSYFTLPVKFNLDN